MILVTFFLLLIGSALQGMIDAILYSGKSVNAFIWNEHILLVAMRGLWFLIALSGMFLQPADFIFLFLAFVMSFSFSHNGLYYVTKASIAHPPVWHWDKFVQDKSLTDSSRNNYDFISRLYLFIGALIIIAIRIITHYF